MDRTDLPAQPHALPPRVADRWLRAQLPLAVQARPVDDTVPRAVWRQVALSLEATGHAAACAEEGTDPSATAVLAAIAAHETAEAETLAHEALLLGPAAPVRAPHRRPGLAPVERTWFRLAGLLAGPAAADGQVLLAVLADHRAALDEWQRVLLAPTRLRRLATSGRPA